MKLLTPDSDGLFQVGVTEDIIIDPDKLTAGARRRASLGYYFLDAYGNYIEGRIVYADVTNESNRQSISIKKEELPVGAVKLGFFLIEDGAINNPGLSNGDRITFNANKNLFKNGTALSGSVLFANSYSGSPVTTTTIPTLEQVKFLQGDFNGDGKDDLARIFNDAGQASIDVFLSRGDKFVMHRWATQQGGYWDEQQWVIGDFNGDGKDDLAKAFNDRGLASLDVHLSNGNSFGIHKWATQQGGFWDAQKWVSGDFNGDGKDDLAKAFGVGGLAYIDTHISNGGSFAMQHWAAAQGGFWDAQKWISGDFNGDGKDDLANVFNNAGGANIDVHLSSGSNFGIQHWAYQQGGFWDSQKWVSGDFNGDGKDDLAKVFNNAGGANIDVHLSSGSNFGIQHWANQQGGFWDAQKWITGDFNDDGKDDLANVFNNGELASIDVHSSTGINFGGQRWGLVQHGVGEVQLGYLIKESAEVSQMLGRHRFNINENSINGSVVGTIATSGINKYKILAGNEQGIFAINRHTGEIKVANYNFLDYEADKFHQLKVQTTDVNQSLDNLYVDIDVNDVVVEPPSGHMNHTLSLNVGTNFYESAHTILSEPATNVTHELWFRTTDPNAGIFSIIGSANPDRAIFLQNGILHANNFNDSLNYVTAHGQNLADGNWHHVAHVIDGSLNQQRLYVNGQFVGVGTGGASPITYNNHLHIGYAPHSNSKYFRGDIDEVRVWNKAKTQAEIQQTMYKSLQGNESNLLGYWNFDNNSAEDVSVNNHNLVLAKNPTKLGVKLYDGGSLFTGIDLTEPLGNAHQLIQVSSWDHARFNVTPTHSMVSGDFNGDGIDDIIRTGYHPEVHLANGDGTFSKKGILDIGFRFDVYDLLIGDFDGDGRDDIIRQAKNGANYTVVMLSNGDGTFRYQSNISGLHLPGHVTDIVVGDFNGDGKDDFIRQEQHGDRSNDAVVYLSNGDGNFTYTSDISGLYLLGHEAEIVVGDFNGDRKDDFIRYKKRGANGINDAVVYLSNGDGNFTYTRDIGSSLGLWGRGAATISVLDFNGDGRDDFIRREEGGAGSDEINSAQVLISNGDGTFTSQGNLLQANDMRGYYVLRGPSGNHPYYYAGSNVITGDFDGDGKDGFIIQKLPTVWEKPHSSWWKSGFFGNITGAFNSLGNAVVDAATDVADTFEGIAGDIADFTEDAAKTVAEGIGDLLGDWWLKYYLEYIPSPYKKSNSTGHTINMVGGGVAYGEGGNDTMNAYAIAVSLHGGSGNDDINSYSGASFIYGDSGNDSIDAYGGVNFVNGGTGDDTINSYGGANVVLAGSGTDNVTVAGFANVIHSSGGYYESMTGLGGGNVFIKTGDGTEGITGGAGLNVFAKLANGDSTMVAHGAFNILTKVGYGNDTLMALGAGNLITKIGDGTSTITGGSSQNIITSWGDSKDTIGAVGMVNAMIAGGNDDIVIALGKGNIAFGDSLDPIIAESISAVFQTGEVLSAGADAVLDKVTDFKLSDAIKSAADIATAPVSGNDTLVTLGMKNAVVGGLGQDIAVVGGLHNFVFGDYISDFSLSDISVSIDSLLPDLSFDFDFDFHLPDFGDFSFPSLPNFNLPSIGLPNLPDISALIPDINLPDLPGLNIPSIALPSLSLPSLNFTLPDISFNLPQRFQFKFLEDNGDLIFAGGKLNLISGDRGDDILVSGGNTNTITGGEGKDLVLSGGKTNIVKGGDGDDLVFTAGSSNVVYGNNDNDTLIAAGRKNTIDGGNGVDILLGLGYKNTIRGGDDKDFLIGVSYQPGKKDKNGNPIVQGGNTLDAGAGDDWLFAGGENNTFSGGEGNDKYLFDGLTQSGDTTINNEGDDSSEDRLLFGGLNLSFSKDNNDLKVSYNGNSDDALILKDWFVAGKEVERVDRFENIGLVLIDNVTNQDIPTGFNTNKIDWNASQWNSNNQVSFASLAFEAADIF
ncbi:laminin G domain-containing protein [Rivularia sp. PCC 7116]|uniref:FG-GAP-like repeat-containing protein n=1 Tax=Rivularia sp. PCC 7116 TaxID=373994 RepID=UPI00029F17C5|nr:FG-GAP-like repeat-containing protein [Rivularia sp. PCC 7116]AFY57237.1 laminin G domain-containing protein [Rivularia sp. PCC 7116]